MTDQKKLRVVVIGAGMAGVLAGIKLKQEGLYDFVIYEKADRIGGTWRENTYPGLTCDVPSHHYTYSFERNPDWTRHFPPGAEIQTYFEDTTEKYGIYEHIRFNTEISKANFVNGQWLLEMKDGSAEQADIVIAATGVLHHPSYPNIAGTETFQGALFHSARWDHSVDLDDKRIGVIGNGSTGVQIISALAGRASKLQHFQRTAQWIMPTENGYFSEEERKTFREDPAALAAAMDVETYNQNVELYTQGITGQNPELAQVFAKPCRENLDQSIRDPELKEKLLPDHEPMCKRLIFSADYYEAIQHPKVELVTDDIKEIEAAGIRTSDGVLHELDVIVFATGFKADQFMRPMEVKGLDNTDLNACWETRPSAYLAISIPDFPNFFMLNGPNGPIGNFSLIDIAELQWGYISQLMNELRENRCEGICASHQALDDFDTARIEAAKKTIWYTGGCNSWYLDAEGIPASWPWNYLRFVDEMAAPNFAHYDQLNFNDQEQANG
jgi:cation diffusion facilitator CzcD-associated flavoprotein CzcO